MDTDKSSGVAAATRPPVYLCAFDPAGPGAGRVENRLVGIGGTRLTAGVYVTMAVGPAARIARYLQGTDAAAIVAVVALTSDVDWSIPVVTGEILDALLASLGADAVARHP